MPLFDPSTTAMIIVALMAGALGLAGYLVLSERKIAAWIQDRRGPNRVGPGGLFQPIADGAKMFLKEEVIPAHVDKSTDHCNQVRLLLPSIPSPARRIRHGRRIRSAD